MTKLDTFESNDLVHCLQRAEALVQVLAEASHQQGNDHHAILIEMVEEYLLRARKIMGDQ